MTNLSNSFAEADDYFNPTEPCPENLCMESFFAGQRAFADGEERKAPDAIRFAAWMDPEPATESMRRSWLHGFDCRSEEIRIKSERDEAERAFNSRR